MCAADNADICIRRACDLSAGGAGMGLIIILIVVFFSLLYNYELIERYSKMPCSNTKYK